MQGWELAVVAGVLLLLFGGSRLPKLARSLGEARTELAKVRGDEDDGADAPAADAPTAGVTPAEATTTTVVPPAAFEAPAVTPKAAPSLQVESVVVAEPARAPLPPPLPPPG